MQKVSNPESELEAGIFGGVLFFANQDNTFTTRKFYRTPAGRRGVHTAPSLTLQNLKCRPNLHRSPGTSTSTLSTLFAVDNLAPPLDRSRHCQLIIPRMLRRALMPQHSATCRSTSVQSIHSG
ncbi:uncharacterized protein UDID_19031 [Ustilago sp. UG-2017a]|nr:uncharacterized protein UDID_19031 [Ustilago sp. UG-2017a]